MRSSLSFGACLVVLASACGCRHETRADKLGRQGILCVATEAEPSDLDPHINIDASTDATIDALFEGLVGLAADGTTIIPGVAERWESSPDGLTYTFHLRADARWSNGAPVTSEDFLFSFRRIFDPVLASEPASFGFVIAGAQAYTTGKTADPGTVGLSAPDRRTFVIRLAHPAPYFLHILGSPTPFRPVYRPLLEASGGVHQRGTTWTRAGHLVGNGPFVLTRWEPGQALEVRKNPLYWDRGHVALEGVVFTPVDDAGAQERGFRSGEFHLTTKFPAEKAQGYDPGPRGRLVAIPIPRTTFVTFNVARVPFTDPRIRRALSLAIDRRALAAAIFHGNAEPAFSQVRPGTGGYQPRPREAYAFNPDLARRLLAEAGYPGGAGLPPIDVILAGNEAEKIAVGEVIQASWKTVLGVTAKLWPTEFKVYLDAERTKQFQAIIESWSCPWPDPTAYYQIGETANPNNDSGWSNPTFDRDYRNADTLLEAADRSRSFDRQEACLAEDVPYAPLFYSAKLELVASALHGVDPLGQAQLAWKELRIAP